MEKIGEFSSEIIETLKLDILTGTAIYISESYIRLTKIIKHDIIK